MSFSQRQKNQQTGHMKNLQYTQSWSEIASAYGKWNSIAYKLRHRHEKTTAKLSDVESKYLSKVVLADIHFLRSRLKFHQIGKHLCQWSVLENCENVICKNHKNTQSAIDSLGMVRHVRNH